MTTYWPLSAIANDPGLHHTYAWELLISYYAPAISENAMIAARDVCGRTRPCETQIVVMEHGTTPGRGMYLSMPSPEDFAKLERGGFHAYGCGCFGFMVDGLH